MSLYSSKIKSDLIDPIVDIQNNRVEFKDESDDSMIGHNSRKALK